MFLRGLPSIQYVALGQILPSKTSGFKWSTICISDSKMKNGEADMNLGVPNDSSFNMCCQQHTYKS